MSLGPRMVDEMCSGLESEDGVTCFLQLVFDASLAVADELVGTIRTRAKQIGVSLQGGPVDVRLVETKGYEEDTVVVQQQHFKVGVAGRWPCLEGVIILLFTCVPFHSVRKVSCLLFVCA
jgi:hypothetical protein